MADLQSNSKIFSVRIVSIDHYMALPIPGMDICYSNFQGGKVNEVPVIRVYGSTPAGQKTCLHIHQALPYLYVPCADISLQPDQEGGGLTHSVSLYLEKALKLKGNAGLKRQHVHDCSLVRARKFYGYHSQEELFVKIYLYYPQDVSRAANLLLGGAVLDKSLQPHESHIPFILQFLIDHNLYGMGHLHLSKMKFRYPVPDVFPDRKLHFNTQHRVTDPGGDAFLGSPVWVAATVPFDWLWQPPSELAASSDQEVHCPKRQSVCELEADANVDDIINRQSKMYSSLSQTHSDVKMVQSLVPIWEEEYERTGVREFTLPPDAGKPLPEDVLKTLSLGHDNENKLLELCTEAEFFSPSDKELGVVQPLSSSTEKGNLVRLGLVKPINIDGKPLESSSKADIMGSLSPPDSLQFEGVDPSPRLLTVDKIQSSEMIGTLEKKGTDKEALNLLQWLATSQAAEDINSDDELVRETILSPLLPATTIDKVLEQANMDFNSESQKECQDILDSVDDFTDFDILKEKPSVSDHSMKMSSYKMIPQVDGSGDDGYSTPSDADLAGITPEVEIKSESQRSLAHQELPSKDKRNKLWGPLPFSMTEKVSNDSEDVSLLVSGPFERGTGDAVDTSYLVGNTMESAACGTMENVGKGLCQLKGVSTLANCSVRDLMRRKRCYRVEEPESKFHVYKKVQSETDKKEKTFISMKRLDFQEWQNDEEETNFHDANDVEVTNPDHPVGGKLPLLFNSDRNLQASILKDKKFGPSDFFGLEVNIDSGNSRDADPYQLYKGPLLCKSNSVCSAASFDHSETCIESKSCQQAAATALSCVIGATVESEDPCIRSSIGCGQKKSYVNLVGRDCGTDISLPSKKYDNGKQGNNLALCGMTICMKPPTADLTDKQSETASCLPTAPCSQLILDVEDHDGTSGKDLDHILPFFEWDSQTERENMNNYVRNSDSKSRQEKLLGVPIYCQNDGSHLYLLTPKISPPPANCVYQWLLSDDKDLQDFNEDQNTSRGDISGPDGKSSITPLSQIGFRDPASVGCGEQLTLLSIEVLAESRADLLPDPRFDAINLVALGLQNDSDSCVEVLLLLRSEVEPFQRNIDGLSGCKQLVFSDEKYLLYYFIKIVSSYDPDILMGWDIQGGSLGFLAERAAQLGLGLLNSISRTPSETKIASGDTRTSEKGILVAPSPDSIITDHAVQEDAIIEDEWGRTHASGVHVGGRVVLNVWRLMRGELKLKLYSVEAVAEAVLRRKIPSIPYKVLTKWFLSGPGRARFRCIEYIMERAKLDLELMNQLDMVNRTSELARVFGIDFFSVLSRGSQYRVESMFLRLAHTQNYLAVSPGNQQVASQPAMECLPLVMEPESGFYADPVLVLDFQSLYPSMIIAYNLCFCTCLGKVMASKENTLGVSSFSPDPHILRELKDQILLTPNGVMFVPPKVCKGVLPRLLEEILSTRIMVKQAMKKLTPSQKVLQRIFNARQLALKLIANVTYGYTAAGFSGRMPCAELADSIVQCGRRTLERAIAFVNAHQKWNARVIYGDTDSMFVLLKGRTAKESFKIGHEIASAITAMNPRPVTLKMEKVYHPCFLLTKKRYVGFSYESPEQVTPVFDAKGIETVRRDTCGAVAKIMEQSLRLFFEHKDISEINTYLQRQWRRIISGRVSLQDFVFAKEVCLGTYSPRASSLPPAAIVAIKAMRIDPRAEPCYGERIPYVVIHGEPGSRLVDMVVDPLELLAIDSPFRINDLYYIKKQIIPALQRVFGLVGADLNQWFLEMPRPARETIAKRSLLAPNTHRTRIDYYYLSKHCMLCGGLVQPSTHLCSQCSQNGVATATALIGRTSKLEQEMQHLVSICRHCGGGDWLLESGVKCTSISCSVFYERRKVQKELQALTGVAADSGFYPRCMVEWF
ncbi:DNA polymerase [Quillaja saponaria]|uniref:DNA polymerase n=1 Tax=Quillaja saponaria TaxID=32244 RepID=A0AAD7VF80_QUISA|nr:DNA polymerase [Quillaja saponaria]